MSNALSMVLTVSKEDLLKKETRFKARQRKEVGEEAMLRGITPARRTLALFVMTCTLRSGNVLVTHEVITKDGTDFISDTRATLSKAGRVLTIAEHYREPGLERIRDLVFEKQ